MNEKLKKLLICAEEVALEFNKELNNATVISVNVHATGAVLAFDDTGKVHVLKEHGDVGALG